jgi:hypothetical protein
MSFRQLVRLAGAALAMTLFLLLTGCESPSTETQPGAADTGTHSIPSGLHVAALEDHEVPLLGPIVVRSLQGVWPDTAVPAMLESPYVSVYVALRQKGVRLSEAWAEGETGLDALRLALGQARAGLPGGGRPDHVELVLAHDFEVVPLSQWRRRLSNIHRGVWGLEIAHAEGIVRKGPTEMIAENRSLRSVLRDTAETLGYSDAEAAEFFILRRFEAEQILVDLRPPVSATRMFRGNRLIAQSEVTRESVAALAGRMADWMLRNVHEDGRMTYKYWPSRGQESGDDNMIRQWMASRALSRIARTRRDPRLVKLAAFNILHNLWHFYREAEGLGRIEYDGKVKLGAIALAALALTEHPERQTFAGEEAALARSVEHLWQEDGAFRTFLEPAERNDNQNFYPGEALLYWAHVYRETKDPALLDKMMSSFEFYRDWHLANRNPAFVPWHSMAYVTVWQETRDPALKDWVFEMNNWLLARQQSGQADYPDTDGRFYDPNNPGYGPPHASSTGVYLEGLIRAFDMARESGDSARAEAYRQAIAKGLRSLMQLEFADEIDMYYISKRERVRGALRTTVYDNEIRVDNMQHGLMAILDILETFTADDYRLQ